MFSLRDRKSCERDGDEDEVLCIYDFVYDTAMDAACSRRFHGRSSMDHITEDDILEAEGRGRYAGYDALGATVQTCAIKGIPRVKPALSVVGRIYFGEWCSGSDGGNLT